MIVLGSHLINTPVMGLQTGSELAKTDSPIIDPETLSIKAYLIKGPLIDAKESMLTVEDIREIGDVGMIVDSSDVFMALEDVIKIHEVYELRFPLLGLAVRDERGRKLGKIIDYTLDIASFIIQQLTVKRPFLQSLNDTELVIHRSQIVSIDNRGIVVRSGAKAIEPEQTYATSPYVNPFRKADPHSEPQASVTHSD